MKIVVYRGIMTGTQIKDQQGLISKQKCSRAHRGGNMRAHTATQRTAGARDNRRWSTSSRSRSRELRWGEPHGSDKLLKGRSRRKEARNSSYEGEIRPECRGGMSCGLYEALRARVDRRGSTQPAGRRGVGAAGSTEGAEAKASGDKAVLTKLGSGTGIGSAEDDTTLWGAGAGGATCTKTSSGAS